MQWPPVNTEAQRLLDISEADGRGISSESVKRTRRVPSKYTLVGGEVLERGILLSPAGPRRLVIVEARSEVLSMLARGQAI